jgi:hypothetical protein
MSPLCESFLAADELDRMEPFYPLRVLVCGTCWLVQLGEYVRVENIFSDYAYFSSYSDSWLAHAKAYVEMMTERFALGPEEPRRRAGEQRRLPSSVLRREGIPSLGVEPAANVAKVAVEKGVPTVVKFFGQRTAAELLAEGGPADVIVGNNVLAQVPDLNDFVGGMKTLLAPKGGRHHGVPPPDEAHRGEPVRHDLPRALLVLLVDRDAADLRRARADPLRRRGASLARGIAADLRAPRRGRLASPSPSAHGRSKRANAPPASPLRSTTRPSRSASWPRSTGSSTS